MSIKNASQEIRIVSVKNALHVVRHVNMRRAMALEQASYDSGTITNGYGQCSGVYLTVQKGAEGNLDIDFTITTVSLDTFNQWKADTAQYFSQDQRQTLEENYGAAGLMGGFLGGAFGILFGAGDYNHYLNSSSSFQSQGQEHQEGFARSVYNLKTDQFHIKGNLHAVGVSFIPTTVTAYVQVTTIKFTDGKEINVINTDNPVAATKDGDTSGVQSQPSKLTIVPLSH